MSPQLDIISPAAEVLTIKNKSTIRRVMRVHESEFPVDTVAFDWMPKSIEMFAPVHGSGHPAGFLLVLDTVESRPILAGDKSVEMILTYRPQTTNLMQWDSYLQQDETQTDRLGAEIITTHDGEPQPHIIPVLRARNIIRTERTYNVNTSVTGHPIEIADNFMGRINQVAWNGYPPRTILMTNSSVEKFRSTKASYDTLLEFAHRPQTWDITVAELDENNDVVPGGDRQTYRIYEQSVFSELGFG